MDIDSGYKFHVQFHITNRCNLHCKHCYEGKIKQPVDWGYDSFILAIEKLWNCFSKWGVQGEISLIGGEPTLHPYFYDMLRYLHDRKDVSNVSILTNGINLSDEFYRLTQKYNCHVQVSIDGNTAEQHDLIRGEGNFDKTMNCIKRMQEEGITSSIHYVLSKATVPISEQFIEKLIKYGVSQATFSRIVPFGNATINQMLNKEQLYDVYVFLNEMKKKYSQIINISTTRPLWCNFGYEGRCPVAIQTITILENGDIYPCRRLPIKLGNILEDNFYKVWYTNPILEDLRNRKKINKCGQCKFLDNCGGARCIAYAVTGDYMGEDPQCWCHQNENK